MKSSVQFSSLILAGLILAACSENYPTKSKTDTDTDASASPSASASASASASPSASPSASASTTSTADETSCSSYLTGLPLNPSGLLAVPAPGVAQRKAFLADGGRMIVYGGRYFTVWIPKTYYTAAKHVVVYDLHGTGGYPEADWNDWHTLLESRGYAYIGYAWGGSTISSDSDIYKAFKQIDDDLSKNCPIADANKWVLGFSVGSAMSFAVIVDDVADRHMFKGNIANSGSAWSPMTTGIAVMHPTVEAARSKTNAYKGALAWMYCGEKDLDHGWSMCDEMAYAKDFVNSQGGTVTLYDDPTGHHGDLEKNATAAKAVLDEIAK